MLTAFRATRMLLLHLVHGLHEFVFADEVSEGIILQRVGQRLSGNHIGFVLVHKAKLGERFIHFVHLAVGACQVVVKHRVFGILCESVLECGLGLRQVSADPIGHPKIVD